MDLLLIKPGAQKKLYQNLSKSLSGLEPPLWAALLAAYIREKGFSVHLIDAEVEPEKLAQAVVQGQPRLTAVVVSGTNPSASTMNMVGARSILEEIRRVDSGRETILVGLHPSALPERTLKEEPVDLVCEGEGFYTLLDLLQDKPREDVRGLFYRKENRVCSNPRAELVNPDDLPMPAWDLLSPERYRAHNWHCFGRIKERSPYAVIYTSLGCPFHCSFCCINAIFGKHQIRYRSPQKVIAEIDYLVQNFSLRNLKIIDEMFDLSQEHVLAICDLIIERGYDLNIWAYARVDTLNEKKLARMKQAGINWLGIGFESGSKAVRDKVSKGSFDNDRMKAVVRMVQSAGIAIGGNFIFGLPDDTLETMRQTLDLAKELNCEYTNFYVAMAYPGSQLYEQACRQEGVLAGSWLGYSQFSYETMPLPTRYLSPAEILRFRDNAFNEFYSSAHYQKMILEKFGRGTLDHLQEMLKHKLRRRLLEEDSIEQVCPAGNSGA